MTIMSIMHTVLCKNNSVVKKFRFVQIFLRKNYLPVLLTIAYMARVLYENF